MIRALPLTGHARCRIGSYPSLGEVSGPWGHMHPNRLSHIANLIPAPLLQAQDDPRNSPIGFMGERPPMARTGTLVFERRL